MRLSLIFPRINLSSYLVVWTADGKEETHGRNLVDAAKETGVKHFVWSTLDHSPLKVPHWETKANINDYLVASGVPYTSCVNQRANNGYNQNFIDFTPLGSTRTLVPLYSSNVVKMVSSTSIPLFHPTLHSSVSLERIAVFLPQSL